MRHYRRETAATGFGTTVYAENGETIGRIRGVNENALYVTPRTDRRNEGRTIRSGQRFGEAELMWRYWEWSELG